MIDIFQRIAEDVHLQDRGDIREKKDIFKELTYNFYGREVKFTWDLYQDGLEWLKYNSKTIYNVTENDFHTIIPYIGLTVLEYMVLIYQECAINPAFFYMEICRVPEIGGTYARTVLDIGKFTQINAFYKGYNSMLYNPRQTGVTMLLACLYNWVTIFRRWSANILVPTRSETDYKMFKEKIDLVKKGLPQVFFSPTIAETYHYSNNSKFVNYLFINEFEFLDDKQYLYMFNINGIKTKTDINIYPADIGFSTGVQMIGNSTINKNPSDELLKFMDNAFVQVAETDFCDPGYAFQRKMIEYNPGHGKETLRERDYYKYILEIRFDETHIMSPENLDHMSKILPDEYYDTEIRRIRPDRPRKDD